MSHVPGRRAHAGARARSPASYTNSDFSAVQRHWERTGHELHARARVAAAVGAAAARNGARQRARGRFNQQPQQPAAEQECGGAPLLRQRARAPLRLRHQLFQQQRA